MSAPSEVAELSGEADIAAVGSLLADPARARVLLALADGRALPASMLALEAGVAPSTASHHLSRLVEAGFVTAQSRGKYRYFALAGPRIAELIEVVARIAPRQPITSLRQGTRAHAMRYARSCYDHLAGRLGVALTQSLCHQGLLVRSESRGDDPGEPGPEHVGFAVTANGCAVLASLGVDSAPGEPVRGCLDWTERQHHLAGPVGRALLRQLLASGWLVRDPACRALRLTDSGRSAFPDRLGVELPAS